jgi:hypothetical protein
MTVSKGRPRGRPRTEAEKAADIKRTGRPATIANGSVTRGVTIRLTPAEHKQIIADAKQMIMSLSVYLRHCWQTTREGRK